MPVCRTLPSRAGAGSYGALSRPLTCLSNACGIGGPCAPRMPAKNAPVAQLDRALDYESRGQEFESLRARHFHTLSTPNPARRYAVAVTMELFFSGPAAICRLGSGRGARLDRSGLVSLPVTANGERGTCRRDRPHRTCARDRLPRG